jgi:hypothetical protein
MPLSDPQLQGWSGLPGAGVPVADTVRAFLGFTQVFGAGSGADIAPALEAALNDIRNFGILPAAQMRLAARI